MLALVWSRLLKKGAADQPTLISNDHGVSQITASATPHNADAANERWTNYMCF